ncbi:hypothetical protein AMK16_06815 [Streptomyces sp. CB00455]|uniref:hypothetical protein n=1 Tax=Streptomyces sp. CB00455 TaxID=1703927 RepID=UPI00093C0682|nr:hypothetical protein [Streptomyces sp. CB00455]OKK23080.1 hypothetical protein AMK16_06815 [Streptomyces sp. CB00455]
MGQKATQDAEPEKKKLDLSAAQVAGSSLATVAAALLASQLGVYGTILGAGVVSVVATAGGPVIQHVFRRTGDQLRETTRLRPRRALLPQEPQPEPGADGTGGSHVRPPQDASDGEFGVATLHGTRVRGWKRTAVAAGAAFALSLGALGTYEAMAGTSVSKGGDTLFSAGTRKAADHRETPPGGDEDAGGKGGRDGKDGKDGSSPGPGSSPSPSPPSPSPSPSPSGGGRTPGGGPGTGPSGTPSPPVGPTPSAVPPSPPPTPSGGPSHPAAPSAPAPRGDAGQPSGS